jgi:cyclic-di-AMP phosphodiesterase PgpH
MKNLKEKLSSYSKIIFRVTAFASAAIALYFILPSEPRFKFEYQKGSPWKHENLVAPFDFAILKSSNEIESERREISKNFAPYFIEDTVIVVQKTEELLNDLSFISEDDYPAKAVLIGQNLSAGLKALYSNGILASAPESLEILKDKSEISVITGNIVFKTQIANSVF